VGARYDALVTHGPYQSALETGHNKALYKFTFFTLLYFTMNNKQSKSKQIKTIAAHTKTLKPRLKFRYTLGP